MKSYILRIDNTVDTFTLLGAGTDSLFEFEVKGNTNVFLGMDQGDTILGYYSAPIGQLRMLINVKEIISPSKIRFEKVFEINNGPSIKSAHEQMLQRNDLVQIPTAEAEKYVELLASSIMPNKHTNEDENIYDRFQTWLTSYDNPDYTGVEQYSGYARCLKKLIDFMFEHGIIADKDLNELNKDKYIGYLHAFDESEEAKEYDKNKLQARAGSAALKKYILYIDYLLNPTFKYNDCISGGENLIVYGTPGCGKSYYVDHSILGKNKKGEYVGAYKRENIIRTTFYSDYSNTDFVGQIVPEIEHKENGESTVTYRFIPGPFTIALECAFAHPTEKIALVIEELNRGNAPSIFGDLFQLLDRIDEKDKGFPIGTSEYGILNTNLVNYLKDNVHNRKKYRYSFDLDEIRLPSNLSIYATMNTSDQNVFTLDTAFKRRWEFFKLKNEFVKEGEDSHEYYTFIIPGMEGVTWESFVNKINRFIANLAKENGLLTSEDKQIGVYFVGKNLLFDPSKDYSKDKKDAITEKFAYKVLEYLWDDVAKYSRDSWFAKAATLDELIQSYIEKGGQVFRDGIITNSENSES